jgi:glutamate N-acetyltransferase/amino-acid N-acetyltransferase
MIKVKGFKFSGISVGLKKSGKKDLGLIYSETPCTAHAIFTKNKVIAAPLIIGKKIIKKKSIQSIIVNSGNANACTGDNGILATNEILKSIASYANMKTYNFFPSSTGIIGEQLNYKIIKKNIPKLFKSLDYSSYKDFANAIITTDKFIKTSYKKLKIGKNTYNFLGIAKGAGMIHPNMATMLCYFITDLDFETKVFRKLINDAADKSFNSISVDGDMSTNDTVVGLSNGQGGNAKITSRGKNISQVSKIINKIFYDLASMIVKDAEGGTKFCKINVTGANSEKNAKVVARKVSNSLLFKTALFGSDPNWGRIIAAIGSSEINSLNQTKIDISIGKHKIVKSGVEFGKSNIATKLMKSKNIELNINLNSGKYSSYMLTNDIGINYVKFNSSYTT